MGTWVLWHGRGRDFIRIDNPEGGGEGEGKGKGKGGEAGTKTYVMSRSQPGQEGARPFTSTTGRVVVRGGKQISPVTK